MTRRDRAAMALAYCWLRTRDDKWRANSVLRHGDAFARALAEASYEIDYPAEIWAGVGREGRDARRRFDRVVLARLALALRALLRADAGDMGPRETWLECRTCGRVERDMTSAAARQGVCTAYPRLGPECAPGRRGPRVLTPYPWPTPRVRYTPLWQLAAGRATP